MIENVSSIKWYQWLWLWLYETKTMVEEETKHGQILTVTLHYKEVDGHTYIVKEDISVSKAKGKHNRRLRRNGN